MPFARLSQALKSHPLRTNIILTTCIGFTGDVICQIIYEPLIGIRRTEFYESQKFRSRFVRRVRSPALAGRGRNAEEEMVYLDLRRSLIFCSFSCCFSVPYFLWVYKQLDRFYPQAEVTKKKAIYKGFLSYIAANLTTPLYMAHVTSLDRLLISREGRDGRRRVWHADGSFSTKEVSDQTFNRKEYAMCVKKDWLKRVRYDFPDVLRYGIFFWGVNWLPMFYYIPPHFRLLYSASLQVVWSGVMSFLLHRERSA